MSDLTMPSDAEIVERLETWMRETAALEQPPSELVGQAVARTVTAAQVQPGGRDAWGRRRPRQVPSGALLVRAAALVLLVGGVIGLVAIKTETPPPTVPTSATTVPQPTTTSIPSTTVAPMTAPPTTTADGPTQQFTDIRRGSTVTLPPAPVPLGEVQAAVWTGTDIIVWGGIDAGTHASLADGAAFNLATGTWRAIAPAPIDARAFPHVAWTGTEMIVWGGVQRDGAVTDGAYNQTELSDGAAYNPASDAWRSLPEAPIDYSVSYSNAVWTGDEVIFLGGGQGVQAAAYDPATNEWRRLADVPGYDEIEESWGRPIWTGTTILTTIGPVLARYDPSTDTWHIGDKPRYAALVGVPDDDGVTRTVIGLRSDTGAPLDVLDDTGTVVRHVRGFPGDVDVFGDRIDADGIWLGDDALFRIMGADWGLIGDSAYLTVGGRTVDVSDAPVTWALNPATQTWRTLEVGVDPVLDLAFDDIVFEVDPDSPGGAAASLYRAPTPPAG